MANILMVGKDLPESESLLKSFELQGHKVFATANSDISLNNSNIFAFSWNKASSISARTLLVQAESKLVNIDRVLIVFDAQNYSTKYESERIEDYTQAIENMVSGYAYFCQTLLTRLAQKNDKITVGFYLKTVATKASMALAKNANQTPCTNTVAIAQGAFEALAENFAVSLYQLSNVSVFLCQSDITNPLYNDERETGSTLLSYFDAIDKMKNRMNAKASCTWVKAGGKLGGFGLFK